MEKEVDEARVGELIPVWRGNKPPKFAGENNAIFKLADAHDELHRPFWIYGKVTWNGVREQYEIEPMVKDSSGVFVNAQMDLTPKRYCEIVEVLEQMGIHNYHRIYDRTQIHEEPPTTLPASLFPQLVDR